VTIDQFAVPGNIMSELKPDADVLIVGAGPVGLFLANECARRGLRWRLVEERASQSRHSKALAVFPRTLEIFDMAGLAAPFLESANRVTWVAVVAHRRRLARIRFAPEQSPYGFIAMVPQDVTERLLVEQLRHKGGTVQYETAFVSAIQQPDHVRITLKHGGELSELTAAFVVGCDGAHSTVRRLLNLPFAGSQYDALFMLADVETNEMLPADELQLCPSEFGPLAIFPMSAGRRRIVATVQNAEQEAPSLERVQQLLAERAPAGIEARAVHWSSYFRVHHRQVARLRDGRIFLAGDAAHIHSPFGGQGMNTGLQDAWNLVWKLDLAVHGCGSEQLLDSYSAERRPVIKGVIRTTHFMTTALGTPNKFAQAIRDTAIPVVSRLAPFQRAFVQRLSQLGIAYRGSPIIKGSGLRYFDESLRGGNGICSRYLLLLQSDATPSIKAAAQQLAEQYPDVVELRLTRRPGTTLLRPDGYVASSAPADLKALDTVRSLLKKQTTCPALGPGARPGQV
jgi:2-polyprenyl-6-methoxyphenol hydroxylase-like FAD-dependent oxidoreductase